MSKIVDFASLDLKDALDLAIMIEDEARERYEEFAEQMEAHHTPEAARFFRFMSSNEEKHRAELAVSDPPHRGQHRLQIVEWLPHAHEHDRAQGAFRRTGLALQGKELLHHFAGREVAFQPAPGRRAKIARHGTTDLSRKAARGPVGAAVGRS